VNDYLLGAILLPLLGSTMKASKLTLWLYLTLGVTPTTAFLLVRPEMVEKKIFAFSQTHVAPERRVCKAHLSAGSSDNEDIEHDEELDQTAYGNRSLAWTNKYRKLLPYEYARTTATNLGLRCREEWDEYLADGKAYHGPYLPSRPDEMYKDDWVSWEDFLGIMRDYGDTQHIVQNVLQLQNMDEYTAFIMADSKRALGLRILAMPHIVYKDKGWESFDSFFGSTKC
jgi:hypothetical protein